MSHLFKNGVTVLASVGVLIAVSGSPTFADTITTATTATSAPLALSQSEAVAMASKRFSVPSDYGQPSISVQKDGLEWDGPTYNITWHSPMNSQFRHPMKFISVTLDANTGTVVSFHGMSRNIWDTNKTIRLEEATTIAKTTIQKLAPDKYQSLQLAASSNLDGMTYSFQFVRLVNQIPAPFDSIQVVLDSSGQLVDYRLQWHQATFPSASPAISLDKASSFIRQSLGLRLSYVPNNNALYGTSSMLLTYTPSGLMNSMYRDQNGETMSWVDAKSGEFLDQFGKVKDNTEKDILSPITLNGPSVLPGKRAQLLTANDAEQIARTKLNIPSDTEIQSSSMETQNGINQSGSIWLLQFFDANNSNFIVGIDAENGAVVQLDRMWETSLSSGTMTSNRMLSMDDIRKSATAFLTNLFPNSTGMVALDLPQQTPTKLKLPVGSHFIASGQVYVFKNQIPVPCGFIAVDAQSGEIINYSFTANFQKQFPDASHVISLSQATDIYLSAHPVQLQYVLPTLEDSIPTDNHGASYADTAALVYGLSAGQNGFMMLNATDGTWSSYGQQLLNVLPSDVSNHYGQKEMELLAVRGLLPVTNGMVHPNQSVSRAEFVGILAQLSGMDISNDAGPVMYSDVQQSSPFYNAIASGLKQGWLVPDKSFYPDKPMTRADAAQFIVRLLGWQTIADQKGLIEIPFKDKAEIPAKDASDAAIVASLGIIPAQSGNFNPGASMSVADMSVAIVRTMYLLWSQS